MIVRGVINNASAIFARLSADGIDSPDFDYLD